VRAVIVVTGTVQGVGFRPFVYRIAQSNHLKGYVKNRADASAEIVIQGMEVRIKQFLDDLNDGKPPLASYDSIDIKYTEDSNELKTFSIFESSEERELSGSVIPPDISICEECANELRDENNRRYEYFFITCTNCGPRFTVIEKLPYDRPNTTMKEFAICTECERDYRDPLNRRFHAQTVACATCGPKIYLTDNKGRGIEVNDPIRYAGRLLEDGFIVAIKGYGGFHIATSTLKSEPIATLRKVKHRANKPFAVMARNINTTRSFAVVNTEEGTLLSSYTRPIVLLKKSESYYLSDQISPGLHNIGVMLPYTALHMMLFDQSKEPAFVMTSANPPAEPMAKDDKEAFRDLASTVDYFLLHNRKIAHRCDDSVTRVNGRSVMIIRRSRGSAPAPIYFKRHFASCGLGLGAELMVTSCVSIGNKAFVSPHIGDVEKVETYRFLKEATSHLLRLVNAKPQYVACDLHPTMNTTRLARKIGDELNCEVFQIQHHHAHVASMIAEQGADEIIGIACDGVGYGADGSIWGGEILQCSPEGYKRLAHLKEQPMVGGDLATYYPLRMVAGILHDVCDVETYLYSQAEKFPGGKKEVESLLSQLEKGKTLKTTSAGRILDAVTAILGVCFERTYEGEPAMKLEALASRGKDLLKLQPKLESHSLDTTYLLQTIFEGRKEYSPADLAHSAESYLARGLSELALDAASQTGMRRVGFSGGIAYNEHITLSLRKIIEQRGLRFFTNNKVPPGDGGISLGQVYATNMMISK
jgi:hydrogenase maturation protein HypF